MPQNSQQVAHVLQTVLRAARGNIGTRWMVALLVLVGAYLLLEPALEARLGVDLPGAHTPSVAFSHDDDAADGRQSERKTDSAATNPLSDQPALDELLTEVGRERYKSPSGLIYTRGSAHGHRLKHLLSHAEDDPHRPGQHGVFDETDPAKLVQLVDDVYLQAMAGKQVERQVEGDRIVYTANLRRRVGYIGGESGNRRNRPAARHVRLVLEGDRFITAFPVRP